MTLVKAASIKSLELLLATADDLLSKEGIVDPTFHALHVRLQALLQDVTMQRIRTERRDQEFKKDFA